MKNLLNFLVGFLIISSHWSCREEIDLALRIESIKGISIQSQLIKGSPSIVRANIQRIFTFSAESRKVLPISSVELEDDLGNIISLDRDGVGFYRKIIPSNHSSFNIEYGRQYRLRAVVEDKTYESSFETLHPVPKMEGLSFEIFERDVVNAIGELAPRNFARFKVNTPLNVASSSQKARLKWNLFRLAPPVNDYGIPIEGCLSFRNPDFSHIEVLDGNTFSGNTLQNVTIFETLIQHASSPTYYLLVFQESLSKTAYDYWTQVKLNAIREGTQFEPEVGIVSSNFKNINNADERVYGYFYASTSDGMVIKACLDKETYEYISAPNSYCEFNPFEGFWVSCN